MSTPSLATKPNLFIVGSMKCGTTILYDFLCQDDRIAGARGKEVHYFSMFRENGNDWYEGHFEPTDRTQYLLDASPTYLDMANTDDIPDAIRAYSPNAKIIIMIRDPIDRAISHLTHFKTVNQFEYFKDTEFLDLLPSFHGNPNEDRRIQNNIEHIRNFSFYLEKIERYVRIFGSDNVLVIHNDDLRAHGNDVMKSVYDFLGLKMPDGQNYEEQRYVTGTNRRKLPLKPTLELYSLYGHDYYASCSSPNVRRPVSEDPDITLNQPVGAILEEVAVGRDGFLFLVGGSNRPIDMFEMSDEERDRVVDAWAGVTKRREERLSAMGAKYFQCMVPEKLSILGEKLEWELDLDKSFGCLLNERHGGRADSPIVNLFNMFRSSPQKDQLYYKTDSHWSHRGAFAAYQMLCHKMNVPFRADLMKREYSSGPTLFDLGSKLPYPVREQARYYKFRKEAKIAEEGDLVAFKKQNNCENEGGLHVGSFIRFTNETALRPEKVLIFGDSFSEYRDHLLTGLLADTFSEVSFAWSTNLDYSLVESLKPDIVLCIMTERFMTNVPDDKFDLKKYARNRLKQRQAIRA